ncbi:MAG: NADH-quinone oxidoreductase subunit N, partial [Chloroflexi bacterium HGW-Chloroflexi-1]
VLNSAIGAYYYLRVTVQMYMVGEDEEVAAPGIAWPVWTTVVIAAIGAVLLGVWQFPWMQNITAAVATLALR